MRVQGLGYSGIALTDESSTYFNPAHISSPFHTFKLQIASSPGMYTYWNADNNDSRAQEGFIALNLPLTRYQRDDNSNFCVNVGFDYIQDKFKFLMRTYPSELEYVEESSQLCRATIGVSINEMVSFSCGASVNWIEYYKNAGFKSYFDLGAVIGLPHESFFSENIHLGHTRFNVYPSVGFALKGMWISELNVKVDPITKLGFAAKFSWDTNEGRYRYAKFQITPTMEMYLKNGSRTSMGIELGLYEAIFIRAGTQDRGWIDSRESIGASIASRGLVRLLFGPDFSGKGSFFRYIDIRLDFATYENYGNFDYTFFGLSLSY